MVMRRNSTTARLFGDALLEPTLLYSPVTEALAAAGIIPHYCVNITGHGWRKLMRHPAAFTYQIDALPPVPPVLKFIQRHAAIDEREAYGNLEYGCGLRIVRGRAQTPNEPSRRRAVRESKHGSPAASLTVPSRSSSTHCR